MNNSQALEIKNPLIRIVFYAQNEGLKNEEQNLVKKSVNLKEIMESHI